jgi:hypothetical protein
MFRFIALFALVAVAFAEPEADPQYLYHHMGVPLVKPVVPVVKAAVPVVKPVVPVVRYSHPQYLYHHMGVPVVKPVAPVVKEAVPVVKPVVPVVKYSHPQYLYHHMGVPVVKPVAPVVKPVVPVVKYVDPHHTEGMTKEGVPEKTDSVKIAEKQHELAQMYEKAKKTVVPYVGYPYAYTGYYPYAQSYVPTVGHVVAKREAEGESDPYLFYNNHLSYTGYPYTTTGYTGYPYTTASRFPYTTAVAGYPYTTTMTGYHYPYTHTIAKREAEGDAQYFYRGFTPYTSHTYNYGNYHFPSHYNTWYGRNAWYY